MKLNKLFNTSIPKQITIVLFIAIWAIASTGCSADINEAITDIPNESGAVLFDACSNEMQTRGASMDMAMLKTEHFGVLAYHTQGTWNDAAANATPNFMYNQRVAYNSTAPSWTYAPIKYWPNNSTDKVSFFAYAPYEDAPTTGTNKGIKLSTNTTTGAPIIDFTVNTTVADQVDLVYASSKDKSKGQVDLQFKHALARIVFSAKKNFDYGNTKIEIKSVSIKGKFYPSAKFKFNNSTNDGSWIDHGTPASEGFTYALTLNDNAKELTTTLQQITDDSQSLILIPQNFEGDNKITIETTYISITNGTSSSDKTVTEEINLNFEQAKTYNIVLNT